MSKLATQRPEELGLRERRKEEKRRRIRASARAIFKKQGYEAATTREIAGRAEVSIGTVFLYARDKRDLLFLVFNDDLDRVVDRAIESVDSGAPLIDQLVDWYRPFYEYFSKEPDFGRWALDGLVPDDGTAEALSPLSPQAVQHRQRVERSRAFLAGLVAKSQRSGEIAGVAESALVTRVIISIYLVELRRWLFSDSRDPTEGLRTLRRMLEIVTDGLVKDSVPSRRATGRKPTK